MKKAAVTISFGTSHKDARLSSLEAIYNDLCCVCGEIKFFQAYTSSIIIKKLGESGTKVYNMDEAVCAAKEYGAEALYIIPTHIIHGHEYNKIVSAVGKYEKAFKEISISSAVLENTEDCEKIAALLNNIIQFEDENEYVLMGHGGDADANVRYAQMNRAFEKAGFNNVHIAAVEGSPDINDVIKIMRKPDKAEKVVLQPFMVVAGDHAKNDMAGADNSFAALLNKLGYKTEAVIKGLGEYKEFRQIYIDKLLELIKSSK